MIQSEYYIIGALLCDNNAIDRIPELEPKHFYDSENRAFYAEILKQITSGNKADIFTVSMVFDGSFPQLGEISANTPGSAMIERHAGIIIEKWMKRNLAAIGTQLAQCDELKNTASDVANDVCSKIEDVIQQKEKGIPERLSDMLGKYTDILQNRMDGKEKPISTGFVDLDRILDGGFERGTLNIIAGRPAMGKTAAGLALARNTAHEMTSLMLSMEMPKNQLNDRNIAALGKIPVSWLKRPKDDKELWEKMTVAFSKAQDLNFYIDDATNLNIIEIRAKARAVKRKAGLDVLVIDQLSFITGSEKDDWKAVGEYTRGLLAIAKELDITVLLLCQLNRECEKRNNKRPILSDLALSGSIEQDASVIIFLYRDEVYNPDSQDIGMCEWNIAKARQGRTGTVGLCYFGEETRFENANQGWKPHQPEIKNKRGFGNEN